MRMQRMNRKQNVVADEKLMAAVRDYDSAEAFERLVDRWQSPIVRMCYRMTGSWADAEDLTQEAFAKLFRFRGRYRAKAKFSTYLWQIAVNGCRDFQRRQNSNSRKHTQLADELRTRESGSAAGENAEVIRHCVGGLPSMYREVLVLRHYEGLKFKEIATVIDVPVGTVASRMAKALRLLETELSRHQL